MPALGQPPARLTVQTCIGCGARERARPCTGECVEVRLDLVDAAAHDGRRRELDELRAFAQAAEAALAPLTGEDPPADDAQAARRWPALHDAAVAALHAAPALLLAAGPREAPVVATTWWCRTCERVDAPQPCIGVCVRRPQEMASAADHAELDAQAAPLEARGRALLALLRLAAGVRPRDGHHEQAWTALAARARALAPVSA